MNLVECWHLCWGLKTLSGNAFVHFFSMHFYFTRCTDSDSDLLAFDLQHSDDYVVSYDQGFPYFSRQY